MKQGHMTPSAPPLEKVFKNTAPSRNKKLDEAYNDLSESYEDLKEYYEKLWEDYHIIDNRINHERFFFSIIIFSMIFIPLMIYSDCYLKVSNLTLLSILFIFTLLVSVLSCLLHSFEILKKAKWMTKPSEWEQYFTQKPPKG